MCMRTTKLGLAGMTASLLIASVASTPARAVSVSAPTATGELCRVLFQRPHMHSGRSGYVTDMATAQAEAMRSWQRFTAWEYGSAWADIALSRHQHFTCKPDSRFNWNCTFHAQPYRL